MNAEAATNRRRGERGETLLEFALASVIFFMTIFGTFEFGQAIWRYNLIADLSQEGARWASVRGMSSSMPAAASDVQTYVISRALGMAVTVTMAADPSSLDSGDTVSVTVQTSFSPLTAFVPNTALTLQSTSRMIMAQ